METQFSENVFEAKDPNEGREFLMNVEIVTR